MSYARFSEGDVYVYYHILHGLVCEGCRLATKEDMYKSPKFGDDYELVITHLNRHVAAGHAVPDRAFNRLRHERDLLRGDIK